MADPVTPPTPPAAGDPPPVQGGGEGDGNQPSDNKSQALARKLRRAEKELESLKKAEEDRKTASLTEVEQLKKKAADLEAALETERGTAKKALIQARFERLAATAGAQNPSAAFKLADLAEVDNADDQSGLEAALKALQKSDPYLFGQPTAPPPNVGSNGGNPPGGNGQKVYTADQVASMSSSDFAAMETEVRAGRAILK